MTHGSLSIGSMCAVSKGASAWMVKRGYWLSDYPKSIDCSVVTIVADYSKLHGDDSHYECRTADGQLIGIHPQFLSAVQRCCTVSNISTTISVHFDRNDSSIPDLPTQVFTSQDQIMASVVLGECKMFFAQPTHLLQFINQLTVLHERYAAAVNGERGADDVTRPA